MSQENKNKIVQWFKYLWVELHRGNFIPLAVTIALSWFVLYPTYKFVDNSIRNLFETDVYVISHQNQLEDRIKELESKVDNQFKSRPNGSGYTSF